MYAAVLAIFLHQPIHVNRFPSRDFYILPSYVIPSHVPENFPDNMLVREVRHFSEI